MLRWRRGVLRMVAESLIVNGHIRFRGRISCCLFFQPCSLSSTLDDDAQAVGKNVAAKAASFNKLQQLSTSGLQQVQYQPVANSKVQQGSISPGTWFGTRGSEVQILSPRPFYFHWLMRIQNLNPDPLGLHQVTGQLGNPLILSHTCVAYSASARCKSSATRLLAVDLRPSAQ